MALDPNAPQPWSWVPDSWNEPVAPVDLLAPDEVAAAASGLQPPPMPAPQSIAPAAPPIAEEQPRAAAWPPPEWQPLTPEEEAQIEIDPLPIAELAPPPAFVADAVSGVGPIPRSTDYVGPGQTSGQPAPLPEDYLNDEDLGVRWANLPIEEQERRRAEIEGARSKFASARLLEESTKTLKRQEELARDYETAVKRSIEQAAQLDAEAKAHADHDPIDDVSDWQKIAGVFASFVGGFGMHRTGRNVGLEAVDSIIERAVNRQKLKMQDVQTRRGAVDETLRRSGDLYRAGETVRLAAYDSVIKRLETEVQQYDPRGTTALRAMDNINAIRQKRAEALAKYQLEQQKRVEALLKEERERADFLEKKRHNLAQEKNDATRAYADLLKAKAEGEKAKAEAGVTYSPDQLSTLYGVSDPTLVPPIPMNPKQYEKWLETKKKGGEATKALREASEDEQVRQFGVGELVDVDGKPLKFRSTEAGAKVAKAKSSADLSVQLIDRLLDAREEHGWSSDLFKSPEWREMQSDFSQLLLEKKNLDELGVIAGPDMALMEKALGTKDPTELRDPSPGLERIRKTTVEKTNALIRAEAGGQKPKRWEPPPRAPKPPKSASDVEFQKLKAYNPVDDPAAIAELSERAPVPSGTGRAEAERARRFKYGVAVADESDAPLPTHVKERVDRIHSQANNPNAKPEEREMARAQLTELGKSAELHALRNYAAFLATMTIGGGE